MKALLFAAGLGTRLKHHTLEKPKALVCLAGKPLIQHAIEHMKTFGISEICINIHHFANQIIEFIELNHSFDIKIHFSDERNELLDTGGGLKKASEFLTGSEPILIYNVDVLSNLDLNQLHTFHIENGALATLVVRSRQTSRYLMFDRNGWLSGWKNLDNGQQKISRPDAFAESSAFAFSGIQIVQAQIFDLITETGKFSIMDLYLRLAGSHHIQAYIDQSTIWMDLGKPEQLNEAEQLFSK